MDDQHYEVGEFARVMGPTAANVAAERAVAQAATQAVEVDEDDDNDHDGRYVPDEVDAITDLHELDAAVAREVFQFHLGTMIVGSDGTPESGETYPQWWGKYHIMDKRKVQASLAIQIPHEWGAPRIWSEDGLPRFSSDLLTAWSILLRFQRAGWGGVVAFDGHVYSDAFNASFGSAAEATEKHPAEAIARAGLRAMRRVNRGTPMGTMDRGASIPEGREGV